MSWNPFKKSVSVSKLTQPQDLDQATINASLALGNLLSDFELAEAGLKSLYISVKKVQDTILCSGRFELKLTNELASSKLYIEDENDDHRPETLDMAIKSWRSIALSSNVLDENFVITLQRYVIDPMKRLKLAFMDLRHAIKLHELKQSNLIKCQRKVAKHSERRRTGTNLVQYEEAKKNLSQAEKDFTRSIQTLLNDLTKFLSGSSELRKPLIEAFVGAELAFIEANQKISQSEGQPNEPGFMGLSKSQSNKFGTNYHATTSSSTYSRSQVNESFRKLDDLAICSNYIR